EEEEAGAQQERRTRQAEAGERSDRGREGLRVEDRRDERGDRAQARERALQLTLLGRLDGARGDGLQRRGGQAEQRPHRNAGEEERRRRREAKKELSHEADEESRDQRAVFADRGHYPADDPALNDERRHAGERERETDASLVECEAMCGVQHERDREGVM